MKMGRGQFYQALGDLKFSPPPGGLSQMGGLKFFTQLGGEIKVFSTGEDGRRLPPPLTKNLLILPLTGKVPPSILPPPNYFPMK